MILLWGINGDEPLDLVRRALHAANRRYWFLDQIAVHRTTVDLVLDGRVTGRVSIGGSSLDLCEVRSAYVRPYDLRSRMSESDESAEDPSEVHAAEVADAVVTWLELSSAQVANRPSAMASNNSKPYQIGLIASAGFDVPETLISSDPIEVRAFWDRAGRVIYKSMSGVRSVVSPLSADLFQRFDEGVACPAQFQEFIPGIDVRVHVVGDDVFATEVRSEAYDYRYPTEDDTVDLAGVGLPAEIASRCVELSRGLDLPVAGIDLRHTPDDRWVCFEVNPSPGFSFYENATGQPIAEAIASYLANAPRLLDPSTVRLPC